MQGKKTNWVGVVQGKLTIKSDAGKNKYGSRLWLCVCECGAEVVKSSNELHQGLKSCSRACGIADSNRVRTKHGMHNTKVYRAWASMKDRCTNPAHTAWHRYGGRGITMCQEWVESFDKFYAHVGDPPTEAHTIDRMDNNRGYEPGNVRWATRKEQSNNLSSNTWVEYDGKRMTWAQWADHLGIKYNTLMTRVRDKKDLSEILVHGYKKTGRKPINRS